MQKQCFIFFKKSIIEKSLSRKKMSLIYDPSFLEHILSYCEKIIKNNSKNLTTTKRIVFNGFTLEMEKERFNLYALSKSQEDFWKKDLSDYGIKNYKAYSALSDYLLKFLLERVLLVGDH